MHFDARSSQRSPHAYSDFSCLNLGTLRFNIHQLPLTFQKTLKFASAASSRSICHHHHHLPSRRAERSAPPSTSSFPLATQLFRYLHKHSRMF